MSKKIIIITSVFLSLILLGLVGYYLLSPNDSGTPNSVVSGFRSFFTFGGDDTSSTSTTTPVQNETDLKQAEELQLNFTQKLRKLSSESVSGAGTADFKAGTVVHYIEKATGHIFEVELFSPKQIRISNTTIPVVIDGIWGNKNNSLIARYLKDDNKTVDTYSLTLKNLSTTTENTITGTPFPTNISDVSIFGTNVFYLEQSETFSTGYISNFDGTKKKQVWNSPIKELNSQFVNDKTVALTTKPNPNLPGFLYLVDTGNGVVKNVLRNIAGLSTLVNGDATQILYLTQESFILLSVFNQKDKSSKNVDFTTFPEKCVWSNKDKSVVYCAVPKEHLVPNSLINWYKGFISFSDDIHKYNTKDGTYSIVGELFKESAENIDVIKPILSENEQYIVFMNKKDNSLWSLDLTK